MSVFPTVFRTTETLGDGVCYVSAHISHDVFYVTEAERYGFNAAVSHDVSHILSHIRRYGFSFSIFLYVCRAYKGNCLSTNNFFDLSPCFKANRLASHLAAFSSSTSRGLR